MSPQLTPAQLQHAIENGTKLVEAKKLEISAYQTFQQNASPALQSILNSPWTQALCCGIDNLCKSKLARAEVELEELEMQVKAYKFIQSQQGNRIQLPNFGKV
jgi:hypothetical protein